MSASDDYADYATARTIDFQRVATWILGRVIEQLKALQADVLISLYRIDPTEPQQFAARQRRLALLLEEIDAKIKAAYEELAKRVGEYFDELADIEQADQRDKIFALFGVKFNKPAFDLSTMLVVGYSLKDWFTKQGTDLTFRIRGELAEGIEANQNLGEIVTGIKGTREVEFADAVISTSVREAESIIRTAVDKLPGEITNALAEQAERDAETDGTLATESGSKLPFIRLGYQQISILDSRTTQICRDYAWKKWNIRFEPVGHKLPYEGGPPRHVYCRSRIVVIDLDDPGSETEFQDWIKAKSKTEQDKLFGAKKMQLWRDGKIKDAGLIRQTDRQLTLDQFRNKSE